MAGESGRDRKPKETQAPPPPPLSLSAAAPQVGREDGAPGSVSLGRRARDRGPDLLQPLGDHTFVAKVVPQGPARGGRGFGGDPIQPPFCKCGR